MKLRQIVFGLLVVAIGFLAMSARIPFMESTVDEADAQVPTPTPTQTPTSAFNVSTAGLLTYRAAPGGIGNTNGVVLLVTSNATGETTLNFYYQCAPGDTLGTAIGKCPQDGFVVFSAPVCTMPTGISTSFSCPTVP